MAGKCPHRKVKKRRLSHKSARRTKFLLKGDDAVYEGLQKAAEEGSEAPVPLPLDEDLPGMGQFYCLHCDRYFANTSVRDEHYRTKRHKKRVKQMMGSAPHTQLRCRIGCWNGDAGQWAKTDDVYVRQAGRLCVSVRYAFVACSTVEFFRVTDAGGYRIEYHHGPSS